MIEDNAELVARLLVDCRALCLIAGNAKQMPDQVLSALKTTLMTTRNMNDHEADNLISNMKKTGHIQLETWS